MLGCSRHSRGASSPTAIATWGDGPEDGEDGEQGQGLSPDLASESPDLPQGCGALLILRADNAIHNLLQATAGEDAREMPKSHPKWIVCGLPCLFLA